MKRKDVFVAAAVILLLALAAYANSFTASFQLDDYHQIVQNHNIRSLSSLPSFFTDPSRESYFSSLKGYRPVTLTTFALNYAAAKLDVSGYHVFNFILHFINALLVFAIVTAVLGKSGVKGSSMLALFVASAFAVHPVQTNTVTYISGRAVLLATMFYLLGFIGFMWLRDRAEGPGSIKYVYGLAVPLFYLLGLMSKEMAISLPAAMLAYDLIFTLPERGGIKGSLRAFAWYIPVVFAGGGYVALKKSLEGHFVTGGFDYPVFTYFMSEARALLLYFRLLVLPVNQCVDHNLPVTVRPDLLVLLSWCLTASCLYLLYRRRKDAKALSFFGFWFFLAMAPESSVVPITDIVEEYRLYLPSVGFIAAASVLVAGALRAPGFRRALAVCVTALLVILTVSRNGVWASPYTFWGDALKKSANPWRAHLNLGQALYADGRYREAIAEYEKSLVPGSAELHKAENDIGLCYWGMGMQEEALARFRKVVKEYPNYTMAFENLGMLSFELGHYKDAALAFEEQNRRMPGNPRAHYHLGISYMMLGRHKDAQSELEKALEYGLKGFDVHYNLALAYEKDGVKEGALHEARAALDSAADEGEAGQAEELLSRLEGSG